jgi:hypothetical protein
MPSIPAYTLEDEAPDEADHHEELNRLDEPALHTADSEGINAAQCHTLSVPKTTSWR